MITPQEIRKKSQQMYWRYVTAWIQGRGAEFFPVRLRVNLQPIRNDWGATIGAVDLLRSHSKEKRGWGYHVQWKEVRSRDHGRNRFPQAILIETCDDLVRLAGKQAEFQATQHVVEYVRDRLPQVLGWLECHVRSIAPLAESIEGLVSVTKFFLDHPWPDCYARQIPVAVDTKFIERHQAVLRQWLDEFLPPSAIRADESSFAYRFGLRDGQPHRAVRVLDDQLRTELGLRFDEFSLPMRLLAELSVAGADVIVVENRLNLLTLPALPRTLAIGGEGRAVTRLAQLRWLANCRVIYWGDVDAEGFEILASLRTLFPDVRSIMMDLPTLEFHAQAVHPGSGAVRRELPQLTCEERAAYERCVSENLRLEQEHIRQDYVDAALRRGKISPQ